MSFGFLPTPLYIAMTLSISIAMLIYFIKYYKAKNKKLSMICILSSIAALFVTLVKTIQVYFTEYEKYTTILLIIAGILFFIALIYIWSAGWENTKNDVRKRKVFKIISILFLVWLVLVVLLLWIAFYLKGKGYY